MEKKYLFNSDSELNELNLNESEALEVMFWDDRRVSYLFDCSRRGTEWGKFLAWTVKRFMGERRIVDLFDYCEYMANKYSTSVEKVARAIREEAQVDNSFMICDLLGRDVIESAF